MDKKKTGILIKEARTEKNYTQSELGDLIGVSNKAVSRWENGESFPDIGIIESLSGILEIKIQDLIVGEKQADDEKAITEIVRLAKLQERLNFKKLYYFWIVLSFLVYSCIIGFLGLERGHLFGNDSEMICFISLAIILAVVVFGNPVQNVGIIPKGKNGSKLLFIISSASLAWIVLMTCSVLIMVEGGVTPFNMEINMVGPFLNNQLIIAFLLNLVILTLEFNRILKENSGIHLGVIISISVLYLSSLYGDILHKMSTIDGIYRMFFSRTIMIIAEILIFIIIAFLLKRNNAKT